MIEYTVKVYDNRTEWYLNGELHREDGPAIEYTSGSKFWCKNGKYHREDCPACELVSGTKYWCKNGKYHRLDGPAIEYAAGGKEWWINDIELSEESYLTYLADISQKD